MLRVEERLVMNKDYIDSLKFIRKSEREDYTSGVVREYDVYVEGDVVWAKFKPDLTYNLRVDNNNFSKYVLNFERSIVNFIPSKKNKDEDVTYENIYISNLDGEVLLDYKKTGEGKIDISDYLNVNVKCDSITIKNCDDENNSNVFEGISAEKMRFIKCNLKCNVKSNCIDDIDSIVMDDSVVDCKINSFVTFNKIVMDGSSMIFNSNKDVNLYARSIILNSSMLGFISNNSSRLAFKYLTAVDSKINSSNSGLNVTGVKDADLTNSIIGNIEYNNDITISNIKRDSMSVIYNNVSDKDSMSYLNFIERYRGEVRGLYLNGKFSSFEYEKIIGDLDKFVRSVSQNTK